MFALRNHVLARSPVRACQLLCLCLLCPCLSGCEIGRSWFVMTSDSPVPFFGIDLLPRRRTSQLEMPQHEHGSFSRETAEVRPVKDTHKVSFSDRLQAIRLPHVSSLWKSKPVEMVSFPDRVDIPGVTPPLDQPRRESECF